MNGSLTGSATTKVVVASGTSHMRDSLRTVLGSAEPLELVRVVSTGSQLMKALETAGAVIVVIDGDLPGLDPDELAEKTTAADTARPIVYLSACSPGELTSVIEQSGGLIIDRCVSASTFLDEVLELARAQAQPRV